MSQQWLHSAQAGREPDDMFWPASRDQQPSLAREFARHTIVVERDLDTQQMVIDNRDGYAWIVAYPTYELLARKRGFGDEVDHVQLTGRQLREKAPKDVGIVLRPNEDEEIIIAWPPASTVARIAVQ
ncbi:hypothetical protein MOQ72_37210 [Saccharopolyspora sp. K220]|uniref:hypothetical protein n=1 Tax=Saccharopolyspora soli TaxID=2926618 RepID=UPI001F58FE3A|nr:hypothetical protein [Saccharopolyspora soli]MCI2423072.1 hypothetical protein [Saccharopolyspora soli]